MITLLFPSFEELSVLLTLLAILALVPAQLLFPYREIDIVINKKRFKTAAHVLGVIAITFLLIRAYLILTT
jgi:hypothetical protein